MGHLLSPRRGPHPSYQVAIGRAHTRLFSGLCLFSFHRWGWYGHLDGQDYPTGTMLFSIVVPVELHGADQSTHQLDAYHCIIGLVLLSVAGIQAIAGYLQHMLYKKGRRTVPLNFTHVWIGRALITLGMINGGLGLLLSSNGSRANYIAYGVVTAIIWLCYISVVVFVQGRKQPDQTTSKEESPSVSEYGP